MSKDIAFEKLIEEMSDASLLVDVEAKSIVYANAAAATLLDYDRSALIGMSPGDFHPHEIPDLTDFFNSVLEKGSWASDALSCRAGNGAHFPADVRASRIEIQGQGFVFIVIRDLRTERLAQLGQSVRQLAHDLRNTLATAQLIAERLARQDDPSIQRSADVLERSIERAVAMCSSAIITGRNGAPEPDIMRFLLSDLIDDLRLTIAPPSRDATGVIAGADADFAVEADYDQLYRLFLNLARNAFAAGAKRLIVDRAARDEDGSQIAISIVDDGPGIPGSVQATLFEEKIWRGDSSGLGLAIAGEIAAAHGGRLELSESSAEGSRFTLFLPRA